MLARAHRLVLAADYKNVVRRGRRVGSTTTVVYVIHRDDVSGARFGFIVAKTVGNAVTRNIVRRRLKSICHSLVGSAPPDVDVVIRALPPAKDTTWADLVRDVTTNLAKEMQR